MYVSHNVNITMVIVTVLVLNAVIIISGGGGSRSSSSSSGSSGSGSSSVVHRNSVHWSVEHALQQILYKSMKDSFILLEIPEYKLTFYLVTILIQLKDLLLLF